MTNIDITSTGAALKRAQGRVSLAGPARTVARPAASKSAAVMKMLTRARGATIVEVAAATTWQPHSVRAYFSGLRKKGIVLVRETRKSGEGSYRVELVQAPAADALPIAEADPVNPITTSDDAPSANVTAA